MMERTIWLEVEDISAYASQACDEDIPDNGGDRSPVLTFDVASRNVHVVVSGAREDLVAFARRVLECAEADLEAEDAA